MTKEESNARFGQNPTMSPEKRAMLAAMNEDAFMKESGLQERTGFATRKQLYDALEGNGIEFLAERKINLNPHEK